MKIKLYNSFNLSTKPIAILLLEWRHNARGGNICTDYVYDIHGLHVTAVNQSQIQ